MKLINTELLLKELEKKSFDANWDIIKEKNIVVSLDTVREVCRQYEF